MPIPVLRARAATVLGCAFATLTFASIAEAKSIPGELRVINSNGDILAEQTQYVSTDPRSVKSDPKADCFGDGTGGSGESVGVPGASALSQLIDAGSNDRDVRPLSISDSFDFGLALCGIGEAISSQTGFFYLKQNHVGSQTGGDQTVLKKGDEILWFLVADFNDPLPDELVLKAPTRAKAGVDTPVEVISYADDGTRTPAEGVAVTGADEPTDAAGRTMVSADERLLELTGTREGSIPSNEVVVCTLRCPAGYATTIGGTKVGDKIVAGKLAETILAGGGDDRIDATEGSAPDLIKCGGGEDRVTVTRRSPKLVGCERVRTRR